MTDAGGETRRGGADGKSQKKVSRASRRTLGKSPQQSRVVTITPERAWMLMNMTDGRWHHNSLGEHEHWRVLIRRGHVKRVYKSVAFYRITAKGKPHAMDAAARSARRRRSTPTPSNARKES